MAGSTEFMATGVAINGQAYCYVRVLPLISYQIQDFSPQIMCGTLDHLSSRVAAGIQLHGWRVLMMPNPGEIDLLLPLIGTSETANVFTPVDTLTEFTVAVRLKSSSTTYVWSTASCKVDKALFRAQLGANPLMLQLDMIGKSSSTGSTWSPTSTISGAPYEWTSTTGAVSINSTVRACRSMVFLYDNHLVRRFNNSVTADAVANIMRTTHFGFDTPFTDDESDILDTAIGSSRTTGVPGSVTFTKSAKSFQISVPLMVWEAKPPSILGRANDLRLDQYYLGIKGSNPVVSFTNVP